MCSLLVYYFTLYIAFKYVSNGNWLITYWDELLVRIAENLVYSGKYLIRLLGITFQNHIDRLKRVNINSL